MVNFVSNGCIFCSILFVHVFSVSSLGSWSRMSWRPRQHASGHLTWTLSGTKNARRPGRGLLPEKERARRDDSQDQITGKSLKVRRKPALDVDQEIGAPALLFPRG